MMKGLGKAVASAAVVILGGGGAYAADLAPLPVKALPPASNVCTSIVDFFTTACQVSAYGVRFYGAIDVGGSYQTNGAGFDRYPGSGLTYTPQKMNSGAKFLPASYAMQPSVVGLQISEPLGGGWKFVGQLETAFDPFSLTLNSGSQSLRDDVGQVLGSAHGVADSSLQGQFYNSLGFAGVSHDTWGTLTFGRQNAPFKDVMLSYDPASGSNGFGLIGGVGTLPGAGTTEATRGTTSVKYGVIAGNYRASLFAQLGGLDEGNPAQAAYQGSVGADFKIGPGLLSIDVAGSYEKDAVAETLGIGGADSLNPLGIKPTLASGAGNPLAPITGVGATITNNTAVEVGLKYTVDRWKFYAGYEWIQFANPSDNITSFTDIAGNPFGNGSAFFTVTNGLGNNGGPNKVYNLVWGGARYSITQDLDIYGAYYHLDQNQYAGLAATVTGCGSNSLSSGQCHGTQDDFTLVLDWRFAPKWDTYIGTTFNHLAGGLDNGYLQSDFWATTAGVRFRW